ncbi:DUF3427 domain-containing protein [Rhodococcus spelaei]|uniref:DUF3427 domain-containing protein n=1 Tax=Rhodococcus spelaei TaxID=2546320 RepID=A0A541B0E4_9NOCA|nr:DEAD/DEAH box helicase [Rhodococcus spelaei]TQF65791.1 DUF3427 domain-containing protein [Rhodococcus spelaei]
MAAGIERLLRADTAFGFIDASLPSDQVFQPLLISNEDENTMLRAVRHELHRSQRFVFSVAFVTTGALALLKQALLDFRGKGVIVTSTYLNFNEPDAFRELLTLDGVDIYVHPGVERGFHAKGYLFEHRESTTAIVGSSNLTARALQQNEEWNLRFSALPGGDIVGQLRQAIERQVQRSERLTFEWIDAYERHYQQGRRAFSGDLPFAPESQVEHVLDVDILVGGKAHDARILPNAMQVEALEAIDLVRDAGERRAVVISATGTGKTILSALDVRAVGPQRMLFVVHREQILDAAIEAYQRVLGEPVSKFGKFVGSRRELDHKYVFATIQSLSRPENLRAIDPRHFDHVLIDEVHRAGAESYQRVIDHLDPDFLLGLTATPERTDGFNVFELFDFNVPYEIRLQAALEADMLAPFHYYGVTDYVDADGATIEETADLARLVADERVDHLIRAIRMYGHTGDTRGLIFCGRRDEAIELSRLLNQKQVRDTPLRTRTLMGSDSVETRLEVVGELERGELDYILTVDIFNEGIDIPAVNQIIMLRQTQSSIVFTQQLGRGLRKAPGKDHLRVIDFIGNYTNNYLIPIALLGDSSLNKDVIRQKLIRANDAGVISGLSSINFDQVSRDRVLQSLAAVSLDSMKNLKEAFLQLEQRLGEPPRLIDFARFDTVDPVVIATKHRNYWAFLQKLKREDEVLPEPLAEVLNFLSGELLVGKRPHELLLLRELLAGRRLDEHEYRSLLGEQGCVNDDATIESVLRVLSLEFFTATERQKYGDDALVVTGGSRWELSPKITDMLGASPKLGQHVDDIIETGLFVARHRHGWTGELQVGKLYSRKDVCRLLNWKSNEYGTIYGYKVDVASQSCPIFVTYHKADHVSESTQYEDEFLDASTLKWFTRSRRTLQSAEVRSIVENEVPLYLFAKKNDAEGLDFTYLGLAESREPVQEKMPGGSGNMLDVVTMKLALKKPMDESLYRYLVTSGAEESRDLVQGPSGC